MLTLGIDQASKPKETAFARLEVPPIYTATDHGLDALLSALTAHCFATRRTAQPTNSKHPLAARDGWIHLPMEFPAPTGD